MRRKHGRGVFFMMTAFFSILMIGALHHQQKRVETRLLSLLSGENRKGALPHNTRSINHTSATTSITVDSLESIACTIPSKKDLHSKYQVNTTRIAFDELEKKLFAASYQEVLSLVKRTNALLAEKQTNHSIVHDKNGTTTKQYFDAGSLKIGSYDYMAGGRWRPSHCRPKWKVAIVIPFRDREAHLAILLHNLIALLQNQTLEFGFFVGEQRNNLVFNRGLMKNIGYLEAEKFGDWDCVIFHDTDLVPMKGETYYGCDHFPRHFAAYTEQLKYRLPYPDIFGGVVGLTAEQMHMSNGYSNCYWGWGGEDDELAVRLKRKGFNITREEEFGYYRSLPHKEKKKSETCPEVDCLYDNFKMRADWEGINNMEYSREKVELYPLYTKVSVDIQREEWNSNMPPCQNITLAVA